MSNESPVSIMMVDDHPLLRKGLRQLLEFEDELEIVAEASSGAEAIKLAEESDPDLITLGFKYARHGRLRNVESIAQYWYLFSYLNVNRFRQ